ncbi:MAG: hypothetical protein KJO38_02035, partial [Gammaproteobacteria bacterium]|nr:hypothetical protein [Gammaproteobacteria bacterium]
QLQRERTAPAELRERSGLRFNHAIHLDPEKVRITLTEEPLQCAGCHSAAADGEHFEPVRMDSHCRSCHQLNFDPFEPDIELPHGNTRAAFEAMEAHFIREFTDPLLRAERARSKPRRLPGKRMGEASCEGDGLDCGRKEAAREAGYQFADTGCVTCHEVRDTGAAEPIDRWFVHPVRLTTDWYSEARFDHRSHLSLGGTRGDEACTACHAADTSTEAHEVLIPERDNCLQCHSDERSELAVDCVACHRFHRPQGTLSTSVRGYARAGTTGNES